MADMFIHLRGQGIMDLEFEGDGEKVGRDGKGRGVFGVEG